jgi:Transglycosylase SLT domain
VRKWSSLAAFGLALFCIPPARAAEDAESLVASVCRIIDSSALAQHLPVAFLGGLIWQESNFRPDAVSPVGARGIAQFMPITAAERGLANPNDPEAAIPKAAELLANLKQRFGNLGLAAAAYNAGAARVAGWLAGVGELPPETRDYVMSVTRHPVEDWSGLGAARLTDDAVFPESSCFERIAAVSRGKPTVVAAPALWAPWGAQISSGFSKGAAMWNAYAGALNAYLSSQPIQNFYNTYIWPQLRLDVLASAALIIFLLAYVRRPLNKIRDELRRNELHLEAILRSGAADSTKPIISKPVPADDATELKRAERAERLLERPAPRPGWRLLARFDLKEGVTGRKLFGALGRKSVATPQEKESATAAPAPPEPPILAGLPGEARNPAAEEKPATRAPEVVPFADAAFRRPRPREEKAKALSLKPIAIGGGLALIAACAAFAIYGSLAGSTLAAARSQAIAGLSEAADLLKTPLDSITGSSRREEERTAMRDLNAALAQVTVRLDQIERDYGTRMDKLSERIDQDSFSRFADIAARLDKLEQKSGAPAASASQLADITTRLDKLEKSAVLATQPAAQFADIATRLEKLEKRAAVPAAPSSEGGEPGARPDKAEKRPADSAANPAKPAPPSTPKPLTLMARAEPSALNERARPDTPKPSLRDYNVEYVQGGIAVVSSRYGSQQVAPGDMIPGAGRVLEIGRRGDRGFVLTSFGVIGSGPAPH